MTVYLPHDFAAFLFSEKPAVTLATSDGLLNEEYYTITYSNNANVGTATVKIALKDDICV